MDLEPCFKVYNLVSIRPKSMKLGQMINLNVIFHMMRSVYRLVTIRNSPQFPVEFRNGLWRHCPGEVSACLQVERVTLALTHFLFFSSSCLPDCQGYRGRRVSPSSCWGYPGKRVNFNLYRGKFLPKLWCCVGGKYNKVIWFYQQG